jgi:hypothetical protein
MLSSRTPCWSILKYVMEHESSFKQCGFLDPLTYYLGSPADSSPSSRLRNYDQKFVVGVKI